MEKYRLVQESTGAGEEFLEPITPNDVRITQQGKPRTYIAYAMTLLEGGCQTIVLKAMGRAINKAVTTAEILKRRMPLHQWTSLSSIELVDVYEPLEEGLDIVTSRRYVSCMKIILSTQEPIATAAIAATTQSFASSTSSLAASRQNYSDVEVAAKQHDNEESNFTDMGYYQPPLPIDEIHPGDESYSNRPQKL